MASNTPVFLFTDFGHQGPYVGQMTAAVLALNPTAPVIGLMHDAPAMRPDLAAYLLPAVCRPLPRAAVVAAVVDPGVGGERDALVVQADGLTFVGPDNGLLSRLPGIRRVARVDWRPSRLSASFHGRDLFGPVAARLAAGKSVAQTPLDPSAICGADWPEQLARIIYIDGYGNCMTGLNAENVSENSYIRIAGKDVGLAETFCRVAPGELFWYRNSQGLVEIAASGSSAARILSLAPGDGFLLD